MPNESINDSDSIVDVIRSYDDLLGQIRQPISFEEAEVLVQIFPESSFYDLQWDLDPVPQYLLTLGSHISE